MGPPQPPVVGRKRSLSEEQKPKPPGKRKRWDDSFVKVGVLAERTRRPGETVYGNDPGQTPLPHNMKIMGKAVRKYGVIYRLVIAVYPNTQAGIRGKVQQLLEDHNFCSLKGNGDKQDLFCVPLSVLKDFPFETEIPDDVPGGTRAVMCAHCIAPSCSKLIPPAELMKRWKATADTTPIPDDPGTCGNPDCDDECEYASSAEESLDDRDETEEEESEPEESEPEEAED